MSAPMFALLFQECYEGAALLAVSTSVQALEARREYLLSFSGKRAAELDEPMRRFWMVKPDELFIEPVEVL